jgi:DNA ligase-1
MFCVGRSISNNWAKPARSALIYPKNFDFQGVSLVKIVTCLFIIFCSCLHSTGASALDLMLPQVYEENINISGWLVSEKLDGVRGYWDGKTLMSKNGNPFHPPAAFIQNFPAFALEGELWGGRGTFEQTISIVKKQNPHDGWLNLKFAIFDVPKSEGGFVQRLAKAKEWFSKNHSEHAFVIPQKTMQSKDVLKKELHRVESLGGEGLIVRRPDTIYSKGRSADILKVKSYHDTEAVVVGHIPGRGKNNGKLGSLQVQLPDGTKFKIGTGFSDKERAAPPPVGTTITFKYYGMYQSGIPKFPSFMRVRQ